MNPVTRRDFLKLTSVAGLAVAAAAPAVVRAMQASPMMPLAPAPFPRSGKARLKLALAAYTFRENFPTMRGKANPKPPAPGKAMDMFGFIDYCAAQGIEGAELTSYFFGDESDEFMVKLRRHAFLRGVGISGTAIGNNFSHPKGPKLAEEIALTKKWIDRAQLMGAPHIRVFAGNAAKDFPRAEADKSVIAALEDCCDYAGGRGIFLGLENHDYIGSADTLLPMVRAVKSPWLGINLDSGNFRTENPYKDFAACVPYAVNVQLKVEVNAFPGPGKKEADLKRFVQLLRDGGYQGWMALEYEAKEDPAVAVPRVLAELKALCG